MYHFNMNDIPLVRKTADKTINTFGRSLLEFCKNNNLFILNGRVCNDYSSQKLTCKEKSTVDYFLSSATLFSQIVEFEVQEFSSLFSDAHCPISLAITAHNQMNQLKQPYENFKKPI